MATCIDSLGRGKRGPLFGRDGIFQRGNRDAPLQKSRRLRAMRLRHVAGLLVLLAAAFLALDKAYLFLISWDRLDIHRVALRCGRRDLRETLKKYLGVRPLGNILLCDLGRLGREIRTVAWVKDVQIRKEFPDGLRIEIEERTPFAVLERNGVFLVDEEGVELEAVADGVTWPLPVVLDENGFRDRAAEKWQAARAALADLSPAERARLLSLECSDDGRMTLRLKDDPVRLVVDGSAIGGRIAFFDAHRAAWEERFGPLESVDLRFDDRVIVRPQPPAEPEKASNPPKETV